MAPQTKVVWDEVFTAYDFGPTHPMGPVRLDLTTRLCRALGVLDAVDLVAPDVADDDVLATVHDRDYIAAVRHASEDPGSADVDRGLGTEDDPAFRGMHEASARIVQGTLDITRMVWEGEAEHGVNYCGGLHHAMRTHASGFCIYNDAAVGIQWLLDHGAERVAYVDIDVHHGDGVERMFWDDPRVLTISLHESGRHLFPGTGWPGDVGGPARPRHGRQRRAAAGHGGRRAGCGRSTPSCPRSSARSRPTSSCRSTAATPTCTTPWPTSPSPVDAQRRAHETLHELAHEVAGGRWVALGGGGYELVEVVPRSWTHLVGDRGARARSRATPRVPEEWLDHVERTFGRRAPGRMGDLPADHLPIWVQPWSMGHDPGRPRRPGHRATRQAIFSHHGLDPWFD